MGAGERKEKLRNTLSGAVLMCPMEAGGTLRIVAVSLTLSPGETLAVMDEMLSTLVFPPIDRSLLRLAGSLSNLSPDNAFLRH